MTSHKQHTVDRDEAMKVRDDIYWQKLKEVEAKHAEDVATLQKKQVASLDSTNNAHSDDKQKMGKAHND